MPCRNETHGYARRWTLDEETDIDVWSAILQHAISQAHLLSEPSSVVFDAISERGPDDAARYVPTTKDSKRSLSQRTRAGCRMLRRYSSTCCRCLPWTIMFVGSPSFSTMSVLPFVDSTTRPRRISPLPFKLSATSGVSFKIALRTGYYPFFPPLPTVYLPGSVTKTKCSWYKIIMTLSVISIIFTWITLMVPRLFRSIAMRLMRFKRYP